MLLGRPRISKRGRSSLVSYTTLNVIDDANKENKSCYNFKRLSFNVVITKVNTVAIKVTRTTKDLKYIKKIRTCFEIFRILKNFHSMKIQENIYATI